MERPKTGESNYEKWCDVWRMKFLEMDQEELMRRLPELRREGRYLTLRHFGKKYGIDTVSGEIRGLEDDTPLHYMTKLDIYTLFGYVSPGAAQKGEWVPFARLKDAGPFAPAFQRGVIDPFAAIFSGKGRELACAAEKLGGRRIKNSDVGFQIDAFACMPIQFLFWDGDDEFEAQANILFDRGVVEFIHVESTVSIAAEGVLRLAEAAGIQIENGAFLRV